MLRACVNGQNELYVILKASVAFQDMRNDLLDLE